MIGSNLRIGIFTLFIISVIFVGCSAPVEEVATPEVQETVVDESAVVEETIILEEQEVVEESVQEESEKFEIFNPKLTYPGAYNGPLYATSEQIGDGYDIDKYMANLNRNGVNFFIGMFPILGEQKSATITTNSGLGYVINNVKKYPHRIIPFFNPGYGGEEIEDAKLYGPELTALYSDALSSSYGVVGNNFIKGFGEVETQEWSIRHNDPKILQLTDLASKNKISFMFHPVATKINDVEVLIETYPQMNFLFHLFREDLDNQRAKWIELLKTHDNLFFSIDAAHLMFYNGNDILYSYYDQYGDNAGSKFISTVNSNYDKIMNSAVSAYKPVVEAVPDKMMWGTEAGPDYSFEPEVYDLMVKFSREFISKVTDDKEVQEALGYKNALKVFGEGVVLESNIEVSDVSSWPICADSQLSDCDKECGVPEGTDYLNIEQEACFGECLLAKRCIDPVE